MAGTHKSIPISVADRIARTYGYDQVVILARKTGMFGGEHVTTYGVTKPHCAVAASMGNTIKRLCDWPDAPKFAGITPQAMASVHTILQTHIDKVLAEEIQGYEKKERDAYVAELRDTLSKLKATGP